MSDWWAERASALRSFPPPVPHRMESMRGPAYSNWVIKNHVLMGPHPGSVSTADMVKNLTAILNVGVTTFACLQHEMPTPHIAKKGAAEPSSRSRSSFGPGVVVHAKPYIDDAQIIAEHARMPQVSEDRPLTFLHLPIHDSNGATTSDDDLAKFVLALVAHIKAGELVYVQCGDGNGRSGTVAALILGLVYDLSSSEALDLTQRCRSYRAGTEGSAPDTHEQKMQVHRLLSRPGFRASAKAIEAKSSCDAVRNPEREVLAVLLNLRSQLSRLGSTSFMHLRDRLMALGERSRALPSVDFTRVLAAVGLRLSDDEVRVLLVAYHARRPHTDASVAPASLFLDSVLFLNALRGDLSDMRMELVKLAYSMFEADPRTGFINTSSVVRQFTPGSHPDVKAGRRTEADVVGEFLDTFKVRSNSDGRVELQDFVDYYREVSCAIEDDNYFQLMMFNSWPIHSRAPATGGAGSAGKPTHGSHFDQSWDPRPGAFGAAAGPSGPVGDVTSVLDKARSAAAASGDFGVVLLLQALGDQDINNDGWVTKPQFDAAFQEVKIKHLSAPELSALFRATNDVRSGQIAVDAFASTLTGRLSPFRRKLVLAAFSRLDADGTGSVPVGTVTAQYHPDKHPAVVASRTRSEVIMRVFLKTFPEGLPPDGSVTLPHFERYYEAVSAAIPSDDEFQVVMWNTWNLSGPKTPLRASTSSEAAYARAREGDDGFWGSVDRLNAISKRASPQVRSTGKAKFHHHPAQTQSAATLLGSKSRDARPASRAVPPPPVPTDDVMNQVRGDRGRRLDFGAHQKLYEPSTALLHHHGERGDDVAKLRAQFQYHASRPPSSVGGGSSAAGALSATAVKESVRANCASRGVKGLLMLERRLQTAGNGNPYLPSDVFVNTLRQFALPLGPEEYHVLVEDQDPDGKGFVDARTFLSQVRGRLQGNRLELVEAAFRQLDKDKSGLVDVNEMRLAYNAREHPDVKSGRRSEADVLREFVETCDIGRDGTVSMDEFCRYYAAVSVAVPDDNFFQSLLWGTWSLATDSAARGAAGVTATSDTQYHLVGAQMRQAAVKTQGLPPTRRDAPASLEAVDVEGVIARLKETFSRRGINGIVDLGRSFRLMDKSRSQSISLEELSRTLKLYGVGLSDVELEALFRFFDRDRSGSISFKEFLRGFRGSLHSSRREVIHKAFAKLDVDGSGSVDMTDLALCFNPRSNPDVLSGKMTERDCLRQFLAEFDSFDTDGIVTLDEFEDYYANLSAAIDDDSYFRLLMWNAWQLDKPNPRSASTASAGAGAGAGARRGGY